MALTQTAVGRTYDFAFAIGGGAQLGLYPVDIAAGEGDTVYVLTKQSEQISNVHWTKTASQAKVGMLTITSTKDEEEFVGEFGGYGDQPGKLIWPGCIALDSKYNVYVTDEWMNRVSVWDKEGNFIGVWGQGGSGDGELSMPSGIAIDPDDNVWVGDTYNHRVQKFSADGTFLDKWGSHGSEPGELDSPWGMAADSEGNVYVADHKNHRAQKFSPDGRVLEVYGGYGSGKGQLQRPSAVAVDNDGDVYVCDWRNQRVNVYAPDGFFITHLVGDAQVMAKWHRGTLEANADVGKAWRRVESQEPEWKLAMPTGIDFDKSRNRLMITEPQRKRVQIYDKVKDYMEPQFNL